jgi:hypothetical protein
MAAVNKDISVLLIQARKDTEIAYQFSANSYTFAAMSAVGKVVAQVDDARREFDIATYLAAYSEHFKTETRDV